jgi:hypothetical protein
MLVTRTLVQLGISEIAIICDATSITLPDGSMITGQSTFTRTNGTTGTVADAVLVAEAEGNRVVQTVSTDAAGNRMVVTKVCDKDGRFAYAINAVMSRDVLAISNAYDGGGVGRRRQMNRWRKTDRRSLCATLPLRSTASRVSQTGHN